MSNNYPVINDPQLADQSLIWDVSNSDWRRLPYSDLLTLFQDNLTFSDNEPNTQYSAPSATGFTVAINDDDEDTHLILTPTGTFATGTITLPTSSNLRDKQTVLVNSTQIVTALTVDGNGATVTGAPTTLGANEFFKLKYDLAVTTWYRVG